MSAASPVFFSNASAFRRWLERHHDTAGELWVGFYKKGSGKRSVEYGEAVDQALCFGWIDGLKKRVDETAYTHRFSPRTSKSVWSKANIRRALRLKRLGMMRPHGAATFARRDPARSGVYSFENRPKRLTSVLARRLRANQKAWTFFRTQPPGYQRLIISFIMSAKKAATREQRLTRVIEACEKRTRMIRA
jgi:uncharacterized protein YdeI (YjbR/CyaY-like superfamily)